MANGGAMLKIEKSRYLCNALTDRHEIRQNEAAALNRPLAAEMGSNYFDHVYFWDVFTFLNVLKIII